MKESVAVNSISLLHYQNFYRALSCFLHDKKVFDFHAAAAFATAGPLPFFYFKPMLLRNKATVS